MRIRVAHKKSRSKRGNKATKEGGERLVEELQKELQRQGLLLELILEILATYFEKDGLSLISSQQLHCPSSERNEKVRMLIQQIIELG